MKNLGSRQSIALGVALGTLLLGDLFSFAPLADARGCRPTGRYVGGTPVLSCSGRTRCRPTGRFKVSKGRRYAILRCPR